MKRLEDLPVATAPRFTPTVDIRISCRRSKRVMEFSVPIPVEGYDEDAFLLAHKKLDDIFQRLGILPLSKGGDSNAERRLPAQETQSHPGQTA